LHELLILSCVIVESVNTHISKGGQISIPAAVRRRWATDRILLEDRGDSLVVRPLPADPISAALGSLRLPKGLTTDKLRAIAREEDLEQEQKRR
jgi:bifunctional DNA-binding transcriptional regulator/antitoxin component of YhaV-PrlF toxin-antitoxin module